MQAHRKRAIFLLTILLAAWPWAASAAPKSYEEGEILVKYRESQAPALALHYHAMWHMNHTQTFEKSKIRKVHLPADMSVDQALALYGSDPDVLFAEPNYRYRLHATPNDPQLANQWGLINSGQTVNGTAGTANADIDAQRAWDLATGSRDVVVAVIDSGVDLAHPDLAANLWTNPSETINGIDDDGNGYVDDRYGWNFAEDNNWPMDTHGHGTHVAGIIGALGDNGTGIAGINWQVSIMPLRFITAVNYGTTADAIEAIEYAAGNGADIINLSWGGPGYSVALKNAIDAAGALVVCAAGNDGNNLNSAPEYPAAYDSANIISVAATNAHDNLAWFSNYSTSLTDLAAPGTNTLSTVPDRQPLLEDDFSALANWTFAGSGNAWGLQTLGAVTGLSESPGGNYTDNMDTTARLTPLNLTGRTAVRLNFFIIGTTAGSSDRLLVEASTDGTTWHPQPIGLASVPTAAISGTISSSKEAVVDLAPYDNATSLHLRLRFISDAATTADGYLIHNLTVSCAGSGHGPSSYQYYNGTSMAAPHVAGAAALVMAQKPSLTPTEVRTLLEATVESKPQLATRVATGGRLNVYEALISVAAVDLRSTPTTTHSIGLAWTAREPVDSGFEIQRRAAAGNEYQTIAIVGAAEANYADQGLADGTTYVYRVLTLSAGERTGYSNEAAATTLQAVTPSSGGGGGGGCFISTDSINGIQRAGRWVRILAAMAGLFLILIVLRNRRRQLLMGLDRH